jgi:hypothetical protein
VAPDGGTLIVIPGLIGSLVDLRATGGTVAWSASVTNDPDHLVTVSPASGTLTTAGLTTVVTIKISQFVQCGTGSATTCPTVTFSPGGATFSVWTGFTLPFPFSSPGPPAVPLASATTPLVIPVPGSPSTAPGRKAGAT